MPSKSGPQTVTITTLLGVAFVVLKLLGKIDWSWWWVTVPFWGPATLFVAVMIVLLLVYVVAHMFLK